MKQWIKSVIWNLRKQETPNQNSRKKKESKKSENSVKSLSYNLTSWGYWKEKRESKKLKISLKK